MKAKKFIGFSILPALFLCIGLTNVYSLTNQFKGVNWADQRDNFQSGVLYVSGLSSSDTYSSASVVADRVVSQFMSLLGSNTVRMPINEPTVSSYWGTYTGAIDMALSKGNVIFAYWAVSNGKPADMTAFWNMWATVVNKYGSNANAYFEIINEPYAYSAADLCNMYNTWCSTYSSVPKGRIILDGSGYAQNVPNVGGDSRLSSCLLAVHDYTFFGDLSWLSDAQWISHFQNEVGSYSSRTICTEFGAGMVAGSTGAGVYWDKQDYSVDSGNCPFVYYLRGITTQLNAWSMGSVYWPGLRDGDFYSMTQKSGSGSGISLSVPNSSGLARLQFAWGGISTATPIETPAPTNPPAGIKGDVNGSGNVDIVDALLIAQFYVGLNPSNFNSALADTNCSGSVDIVDALLIAQFYVGLIASFPC
jgi:hypothetical protein